MALFKGFGLIDIIFLILCILITYEAATKGFFLEILKLIGLLIGALFAFHFYPFLAANVTEKLPFSAKGFSKFLAFCLLFFSIIFVSGLLSRILNSLFKRQTISSPEKIAAVFTGFISIIFLSSSIAFLLHLLPVDNNFFRKGSSGELLKNIAPKAYMACVRSYKKIQPNFKVNEEVEKLYEVKNDISGNNKKGD
jgi:uncharacterized membrane protein required for colicin V production